MAMSVSAQTVTESKTFDNFYIGINGGVATATTGHGWLKNLQPNAGLRIGRNFTPVFGMAVESNAYLRTPTDLLPERLSTRSTRRCWER